MTTTGRDMTCKPFEAIAELVRQKARHRKGWLISEATPKMAIEHAEAELQEIRRAESSAEQLEEIADVLGCVYHLAIMLGFTEEQVEREVIRKLKARFTFDRPTPPPAEGESQGCPKCRSPLSSRIGDDLHFTCGTLHAVGLGKMLQSDRCQLIELKTANAKLAADLQQAEKRIELAGGYHQRTSREVEIEAALNETRPQDRDSADNTIAELLELVDAGRNRLHEEIERRDKLAADLAYSSSEVQLLLDRQVDTAQRVCDLSSEVEGLRRVADAARDFLGKNAARPWVFSDRNEKAEELAAALTALSSLPSPAVSGEAGEVIANPPS